MSAIDGERSPKRQRLESFSPESPAVQETKHFGGMPPETPPPSVRMSPSWQSTTSTTQSVTNVPGASSTMPTPPNTAGLSSQMVGRSMSSEGYGSVASTQNTPATDVDMEMQHDGNDAMLAKQREEEHEAERLDSDHRRTDHERKPTSSGESNPAPPLYGLANAMLPIAPAQPNVCEDFIHLYSLQRIQASVARRDPITGEKINKLRKSYENKVRSLNLSGRNKPTPNRNELAGLLDPLWSAPTAAPDVNLFQERHQGRELGDAAFEQDLFAKLDAALDLPTAPLPPKEHEQWKSLLGLEVTAGPTVGAANDAASPAVVARTAPGVVASRVPSAPSSPRTPAGASAVAGAARPERAGKKRRYDESSYAGYDGYDDDGQPLKQRKVHVT